MRGPLSCVGASVLPGAAAAALAAGARLGWLRRLGLGLVRGPLSCVGAPVLPARGTGPQQPASGSGEPRKRLKLRSAMLKYVSCLGMTTRPTPPTQGSTAPTKSGFSLESEGFLLAKTKRNPSEISFRRLYKGRTTLKPLPGRTLCRPLRRRLYTPPGVCPSWALYWSVPRARRRGLSGPRKRSRRCFPSGGRGRR